MELIKSREKDDDREIFSVHGEDEEEEEGEGEGEGEEVNGDVQVMVSPASPSSPYMRKNILYISESQSNLAATRSKVGFLGDDLKQFPPDSASIYSAHSMLSIHSAVEAESSRHEENEVRVCVCVCVCACVCVSLVDCVCVCVCVCEIGAAVWASARRERSRNHFSEDLLPLLQSWRRVLVAHRYTGCLHTGRGELNTHDTHNT